MHYLKFMLHIIETCLPLNGRLYIFRDALHFLGKMFYFERDTGRVHETISRILYKMHICFNMRIPELCVFTFMIYDHLWLFDSDYLIAFNKNNLFHKETLKIS